MPTQGRCKGSIAPGSPASPAEVDNMHPSGRVPADQSPQQSVFDQPCSFRTRIMGFTNDTERGFQEMRRLPGSRHLLQLLQHNPGETPAPRASDYILLLPRNPSPHYHRALRGRDFMSSRNFANFGPKVGANDRKITCFYSNFTFRTLGI
ncbi:hypothetical protein B0H10DRAFT_1948069 [Mycena sp. CBHHK59/15]|nr:hypothetical protein B0H10DRAFT_1948069 [Mycena sp. CBHHK59/15]